MSVAKRRLHLLEESAEDESELSWGYERAPEGMPGSLPWGDPSRTRCFENEAYEAPLRRFGSHMTRVALALTFVPAAGQSPTRGSSTTRARTRPTRRWTMAAARRSPRRPREARMASSGSLLLGPMTALGLVPLLRLTTGRDRPPSGHRYCSNSFFKESEGSRCGRRGRRAGVRRTPAAWLARRHWDTKRRGGSRSERDT